MGVNENIEAARRELTQRSFDHGVHWRILFLGRSVNGTTDIVSCLSRSLRNLGHRVLDIDLKRHRTLIDNPARVQGGNGPVYVKVGPLENVLRRFRPQMIVCCAGGLTFRPEDAQLLKARGIVLVGLTLSDPDVFPTVSPHAGVFDFHTTNAMVAMDMYRASGVNNTLYFPFGIDRGFVTQEVPRAPELSADVICIGHATSRPERNEIMTRVAGSVDVRTYGRGWDLPGSEVVEGRRMVQASREGRIHVNFPLTRAGYINIKCGVFESVGSGALVATGRFPEMADFFAYDDEILGYSDTDDLIRQLEAVIADPARYKVMTERAFDRLINHHLYEHRWIALLEQIRATAVAEDTWLGAARAGEIATTLAESLPRAKHIVLSGFYGASNVGDELILRSISERIEAADSAAQVWVAAENPDQVERNHGLQSFSRKSLPHALHAARTASGVVLGGGGLWHDYTFERSGGLLGLFNSPQISIAGFGALPLMGRMFDAPFHVVGMGIGPLRDADAKRMVRFIGGQAESVMVRDDESARFARDILPDPSRVRQAPDVVYGLALDVDEAPMEISALRASGARIIGLNLRPWAHTDEDRLVEAVVESIRSLAIGEALALIGIPMQAGERVDPLIIGRVAKQLGKVMPVMVLPAPLSTEQLLSTLASIDVLLSMRLHACLLAHRLAKPVVGIAYDPKVANHFLEIGREPFCLELPLDRERLTGALSKALSEGGRLPADVGERISLLEREAARSLDDVAARLAAAPTRPVVFEVPLLEPAKTPVAAVAAPVSTPSVLLGAARAADAMAAGFAKRHAYVVAGAIAPSQAAVSTSKKLLVSLPTISPCRGDGMSVSGEILLPGEGDVEIALQVVNPYTNEKAVGRIRWTVEIGDSWRCSEDLASSADPLQVRIFTRAGVPLLVKLEIYVGKTTFASAAWPRVSQVALELQHVVSGAHGQGLQVITSRAAPVPVGTP